MVRICLLVILIPAWNLCWGHPNRDLVLTAGVEYRSVYGQAWLYRERILSLYIPDFRSFGQQRSWAELRGELRMDWEGFYLKVGLPFRWMSEPQQISGAGDWNIQAGQEFFPLSGLSAGILIGGSFPWTNGLNPYLSAANPSPGGADLTVGGWLSLLPNEDARVTLRAVQTASGKNSTEMSFDEKSQYGIGFSRTAGISFASQIRELGICWYGAFALSGSDGIRDLNAGTQIAGTGFLAARGSAGAGIRLFPGFSIQTSGWFYSRVATDAPGPEYGLSLKFSFYAAKEDYPGMRSRWKSIEWDE